MDALKDCPVTEPCTTAFLCCPKSLGGSKCIKDESFENVEAPKKYDNACTLFSLVRNGEDQIETLEFRDCSNKDPCNKDELCCPKKTGGEKCIKKSEIAKAIAPKTLSD